MRLLPSVVKSFSAIGFGFVLILGSQSVYAESLLLEPRQQLKAMIDATRTLNYHGTAVYLRDSRIETMRVFHAVIDGVERERVRSLNGSMREIIREGDKVTCYFPDTRSVVVEYKPGKQGSYLVDLPEDLDEYQPYYDFHVQGREIVAQRLAQVIGITPRDEYRYARRVWIDHESNLPLRVEVLGHDGQIVEQVVFTALIVEDSIPEQRLLPETEVDESSWQIHKLKNMSVKRLNWFMPAMPEGFRQVLHTRRNMHRSQKPVEQILLSDGFSSVSVYIDSSKDKTTHSSQRAVGAIHSYSLPIDDFLVTVLGDVPARTVEMIGQQIRYSTSD